MGQAKASPKSKCLIHCSLAPGGEKAVQLRGAKASLYILADVQITALKSTKFPPYGISNFKNGLFECLLGCQNLGWKKIRGICQEEKKTDDQSCQ